MAHQDHRATSSETELTILILCHNEQGSITHCVQSAFGFLERNNIRGEILVVDNASHDDSATYAESAGARVIHEPRQGYGYASNAGIAAAQGDFIIMGDGDGEHDLDNLEPFWAELQRGYDFVIGNRFRTNGPKGSPSSGILRRYVGNPVLSRIGRHFFPSPARDFHCGLRAFRTNSVRALALQSPGMELSSEMIAKAVRMRMRIAEVPVIQQPTFDPNRSSKLRTWRDGWRHLRVLLMFKPRWFFLYPGCLLLTIGAIMETVPIFHRVEAGGHFGAYTMLYGSAAIVAGNQLVILAFFSNMFYAHIGMANNRWGVWLQKVGAPETIFVVGFILAVLGSVGSIWGLFLWDTVGDFLIDARLRVAIPSVTLLIISIQLMSSVWFMAQIASSRYSSPPENAEPIHQ